MAWIRLAASTEELVVASDSRLRAGYAWDAAPKLLRLPRGDGVLAFAGSTDFAYPMMLQAWNAVDSWSRSRDRTQPLSEMKGHLIRVFNGMLTEVSDLPLLEKALKPEAIFLLAGYSWFEQRFRIWTLHYDNSLKGFTFRPAPPWRGVTNRGKVLAIVGDECVVVRNRLVELLRLRKKLSKGTFDLEPFEVLESMISDPRYPTIGGNAQVVKVYRSLQSVPFVIRDEASGRSSLLGRQLLPYESPDRYPVLRRDPPV